MSKAWLPSAFLPDFLRSELRVGEAGMQPLLAALDDVVRGVAQAAALRSLDLQATTTSVSERRAALAQRGFETSQLNAQETHAFFDALMPLLEQRGFLSSVQRLAQIYFPGSHCSLGRPLVAGRLGSSHRVRVADLGDRRRTVFIRTVAEVPSERVSEFMGNLSQLLPEPYRAVVAFPRSPSEPKQKWTLSTARSWENRRVECHISHR